MPKFLLTKQAKEKYISTMRVKYGNAVSYTSLQTYGKDAITQSPPREVEAHAGQKDFKQHELVLLT